MDAHAIYSPSSIYRNLNCIGAIAKSKEAGPAKESIYAAEGTLAHEYIQKALVAAHKKQNYTYDLIKDDEMRHHVMNYVGFIGKLNTEFRKTHHAVKYYIEERVVYDNEFWGTADYVLTGFSDATGKMEAVICDFKYGRGVEVEAEDNEQLMGYAICLQQMQKVFFDKVICFIFQPRTPGKEFSRWDIDYSILERCAKSIVLNKMQCLKVVERGVTDEDLAPGEWCRFCNGKDICKPYRNDMNSTKLKILDSVPEVPHVDALTLEDKLEVFKRRKAMKKFIDDICTDLMIQATKGTDVPGWKLVEGQRRRHWSGDTDAVAEALVELGVENPFKKSLIGIGEVEKQIGKGKLENLTGLSDASYQLVPEEDKRQKIETISLENITELNID